MSSFANTGLWHNGNIPVEFDAAFPIAARPKILQVMKDITDCTNVLVRLKRASDIYTVEVHSGSGSCGAGFGPPAVGGAQRLGCDPTQPLSSYIHEFGHIIGLSHEHQRPDRDTFMLVDMSNSTKEMRYNYEVRPKDRMLTDYDYDSVMHYGPSNVLRQRKIIDPSQLYLLSAFGGKQLSQKDISGINNLYQQNAGGLQELSFMMDSQNPSGNWAFSISNFQSLGFDSVRCAWVATLNGSLNLKMTGLKATDDDLVFQVTCGPGSVSPGNTTRLVVNGTDYGSPLDVNSTTLLTWIINKNHLHIGDNSYSLNFSAEVAITKLSIWGAFELT